MGKTQKAPSHLKAPPSPSPSEEYYEMEKIDIGDHIKIKQCLDEAACSSVLDSGHPEDSKLDNLKISLMLLACCFAMIAQFGPIKFPEEKNWLGLCCAMYFICRLVLKIWCLGRGVGLWLRWLIMMTALATATVTA